MNDRNYKPWWAGLFIIVAIVGAVVFWQTRPGSPVNIPGLPGHEETKEEWFDIEKKDEPKEEVKEVKKPKPDPYAKKPWARPKPATLVKVIFPTQARRYPNDKARVLLKLGTVSPVSWGASQYQVVEKKKGWYRVRLAIRPNNTTGWVKEDHVEHMTTPYRIYINRSNRNLEIWNMGKRVKTWKAVVGTKAAPTPAGDFAVSEHVRQRNPNAFKGNYITLLTAHSNVLFDFDGGPGRTAIHGRGGASLGDPLGTASSHGCVRMDNKSMDWIVEHIVPGTPVYIR